MFPVAGDGVTNGLPALGAPLAFPPDVSERGSDGSLYVTSGHRVRRVDPGADGVVNGGSDETIVTVAGTGVAVGTIDGPGGNPRDDLGDNGRADAAALTSTNGVYVDPGGRVYVGEFNGHRVRVLIPGADGKVDGDADDIIRTVAGTGTSGYSGDTGAATSAMLSVPVQPYVDAAGNLYISEHGNSTIRRVAHGGDNVVDGGAGETITTVAGNGNTGVCHNVAATGACLNDPHQVTIDSSGHLFIVDLLNHRVARVDAVTSVMTTVVGTGTGGFSGDSGPATSAMVARPSDLSFDGLGRLYIVDRDNHRIRRIEDGADGLITGSADPAEIIETVVSGLAEPLGFHLRSSGTMYIANTNDHRVLLSTPATSPVVGNGTDCGDGLPAIAASCLARPASAAVSPDGNFLYVADTDAGRIRRVDVLTGVITTVREGLTQPQFLAVNPTGAGVGDLFISEPTMHRVQRIRAASMGMTTVIDATDTMAVISGNGAPAGVACEGTSATGNCLNEPRGLAVSYNGRLYIGQSGMDGRVVRVEGITGASPAPLAYSATAAGPDSWGLAVNPGGDVYIARRDAHQIARAIAGGDGIVQTTDSVVNIAGTGAAGGAHPPDLISAPAAQLNAPVAVQIHPGDGHLMFTNAGTHTVHVIDDESPGDGVITGAAGEFMSRIAGGAMPTPGFCGDSDPPTLVNARDACMKGPLGIAWDNVYEILYIADLDNDRVRKIPSDSDGDGLLDITEDPNQNGYQVGVETDEENVDTDGDQCADSEEGAALPPNFGGDRNAKFDGLGQWDFFDVPAPPLTASAANGARDGAVSLTDVASVLFYFGTTVESPNDPNANGVSYGSDWNGNLVLDGAEYDRTPSTIPAKPWRSGAPDGAVSLSDAAVALLQFGHDCMAPP
jgi:sugar lactone lactonase YvrE